MAIFIEALFVLWLLVILAMLGHGVIQALWYLWTYQPHEQAFPELKGKRP